MDKKNTIMWVGIVCLAIWCLILSFTIGGLMETKSEGKHLTEIIPPSIDQMIENSENVKWLCIDWYGSCGRMVFDNASGMYVPDGYIHQKECEGACKDYSLHKKRKLPTASELMDNILNNKTMR